MSEKIGKYEVLERIGRGGMGMIYRARDPILERLVALKVISTDVEVTDELRARFFREAQACARLNHPNIVTVYDMGEHDGRLYIVMELLEGHELRRFIRPETPLTLEDKLSVMVQVCGGLHYAHQKGIVHRDIKPGNIFLLPTGQVKILDFGIAHMASTEGLTRTGLIMGTLRYISPEQVRGRSDHRSDMFSMASVFYELLTLRPPFLGDDPMHLLEQLRTDEPPPPSEFDATIPPALTTVVQRAMRKDPAERFRDLEEMRRELEQVQRELSEERLRVGARVRGQRERLAKLQGALAERLGATEEDDRIPPVDDRKDLSAVQQLERELAVRIQAVEADLVRADRVTPAVERADALLQANRFEEALAQFEAIVADMPEHRRGREGLERARAGVEAHGRRRQAEELRDKARAALKERRYAVCLEILKQASDLSPPDDVAQELASLRQTALAEQEALRRGRQAAEEASKQLITARGFAQAEDAAQYARVLWNEAEALAAAAHVELRREAYAEAREGFDRAVVAYQRAADAARAGQTGERETAERAREGATQEQQRARAAGAAQYAPELWETAEARFADAQVVFAKQTAGRGRALFTEASGLYQRAEEAARGAREREHRRAEAARERASEARRSAAAMEAERRAPSAWNEAVTKSTEAEAAWVRREYGRATDAFETALGLYHQAQAQVRELVRLQREASGRKQREVTEGRRRALAVEAALHAAAEWAEAEASAGAAEAALERDSWEEAVATLDKAAALYRLAEERARDVLRARLEAERAVEAGGIERREAAEAGAARSAPEAWKAAEIAEARAVAAFSQQQYAAARSLFEEVGRLYAVARRAADLAAEAEARRVEDLVVEARRLLDGGDLAGCLERVNEILTLRPGHAAAEALRARVQETRRQAEEAVRQAEALRQAEAVRQAEAAQRAKESAGETPSTVRVSAPTEFDDAPTVLIRPSEVVKPPAVSADREDATVLASAPTSGDATRLSVAESPAEEPLPSGARRAALDVAEKTPPRSWRLKPLAVVVIGGGALAAAVLVAVSWRSEAPRSSPPVATELTPAPQPTPPPRPAAAPAPQPSKAPGGREPAELAGKSNEQNLERSPKGKENRPAPPDRKEAELRVLEGRVAEARRAAEVAEAPKLAGPLWAKADTAQRRAEDAVKRQAFDRAPALLGDAQKAYQDAERTARAAAADARKRAMEEAEQARAAEARAQQEANQRAAAAEQARAAEARAQQEANQRAAAAKQARAATVQRQQTDAEQTRNLMLTARRAAEQSGADHHAAKLLDSAQTKERDGQAAFARSEYDAAGRLFREAQSDYQSAAQEARREAELERRQLAMLKTSADQSRSKAVTRREEAVKSEAERLAKTVFDAAQAKQAEADGLAARQNFAGANQTYQDAADRYMEAGLQAQRAREARGEADAVRARMLAEKQRADQAAQEFGAASAEERQGNSLYERLAFKDAAEKFRSAERLFAKAAAKVAPPPTPTVPEPKRDKGRQRPAAPGTTF